MENEGLILILHSLFYCMALPFFYIEETIVSNSIALKEETSRHIVQVLRMQNGEQLQLTDGKGNLFVAEITDNKRKKCVVKIVKTTTDNRQPTTDTTIAISLIKNANRFEWFLEKATEIGVTEIIPLICTRTEKQNFRYERMNGILISAMLQSQQTWLPVLHQPTKFNDVIKQATQQQKMIAHCEEEKVKTKLVQYPVNLSTGQRILIGPEGDFTKEEIEFALQNNFTPVALGETRLRTETAGVVAATLLCIR